jgi:hypothetical protein
MHPEPRVDGQAGQRPVADHEVPSVVGQGAVAQHEGDRVCARDDLARIVLSDEDELGKRVSTLP